MVWEYVIGGLLGSVMIGVAIYPAFKVMPFVYGASRVRAARSKMFSDSELNDFANASYKDVIYHLEKRGVAEIVGLIDQGFREDLIQKSLRDNYLKDLVRITTYVPGEYKKFFKLLQTRDTFEFILAVLRSKTSPYYERHWIHEMFFERENLFNSESLEKMSLDDFLRLLKRTPYYKFIGSFEDEIKAGNLFNFEKSFNEEFFKKLRYASRHDESLKRYVRRVIDLNNVRSAISFRDKAVFITNGSLEESTVAELKNAKNISSISKLLHNTYLNEFVNGCETTVQLENALMKMMKAFGVNLIKNQPLSVNPMLSYYIQKKIEFKNVRIILKLIKADFEPDQIRGVLI